MRYLAATSSSSASRARAAEKSGGYRTVIAYRSSRRSVFLYGFAKSERDNIDDRELKDLKKLARQYLGYSNSQIATALEQRELREVVRDDEKEG